MLPKTIEVCSIHIGPINFALPGNDRRQITFVKRGDVGVAMVDEKEAAHLLGGIGRPHYFKAGVIEIEPEKTEKTDKPDPENTVELSLGSYASIPNANALDKALKGVTDTALLMQLIQTESNSEKPRESWLNRLNGRLEELTQK